MVLDGPRPKRPRPRSAVAASCVNGGRVPFWMLSATFRAMSRSSRRNSTLRIDGGHDAGFYSANLSLSLSLTTFPFVSHVPVGGGAAGEHTHTHTRLYTLLSLALTFSHSRFSESSRVVFSDGDTRAVSRCNATRCGNNSPSRPVCELDSVPVAPRGARHCSS